MCDTGLDSTPQITPTHPNKHTDNWERKWKQDHVVLHAAGFSLPNNCFYNHLFFLYRKTSAPGWCLPSTPRPRSPTLMWTSGKVQPTPLAGPQTAQWLRSQASSWSSESSAASPRIPSTRWRFSIVTLPQFSVCAFADTTWCFVFFALTLWYFINNSNRKVLPICRCCFVTLVQYELKSFFQALN